MTLSLDNFSEEDEQVMRESVDRLIRQDKQIGCIISSKVDARQSGFSLHVKFERRTDPFLTSDVAQVYEHSPFLVCHIMRKLLGLPDDYDPDEGEPT
jgi:hypothetical protein